MLRSIDPLDPAVTYGAILDALPIVGFMANVDGEITYLSRGWERLTGNDADLVLERGYHVVIHPDDLERTVIAWDAARLAKRPYRDEYRVRLADGGFRWMQSQAAPVYANDGRIVGWFGTLTDIDSLRLAERELSDAARVAEEHAREATARAHFVERLMDSSDDCIKVLDLDASLVSISANGQRALAIDDFAAVKGGDWFSFWSGDDRIAAQHAVDEARQGRVGRFTGMYAVRSVETWWNVVVVPVLGRDGSPERLLVTSRDVTERRQTRNELVRSEERYRLLGESLPGVTWTAKPNGELDHISGLDTADGTAGASALGHAWLGIVHPDDRAETQRIWHASLASGEPYEAEFRVINVDGDYRWQLVRALPQRDDAGTITQWVGVNIDIDDKHVALEHERHIAVTLQEASLPTALPNIPNLFLDADYRPGRSEAMIGGDWYDAFALKDGRIMFTIGDVLGKGLAAAVIMGKIRQAIRAVAVVLTDPNALLDAADHTIRTEAPHGADVYATAIVGVFDPVQQTFTFASAGHPGPTLRHPDGTVEELIIGGTILGLRSSSDDAVLTVSVPPGSGIVFVTDGLLEHTRNIDEGVARVIAAVGDTAVNRSASPARAIANFVLDGSPPTDDVAVLVAEFGPSEREAFLSANRRRSFESEMA